MNKKLIAVAIAGAFAGASSAVMAGEMVGVNASGYIDTILTVQDESRDDTGLDASGSLANDANQKFSIDGEVDLTATQGDVMARIDLDINNSNGTFDSGEIEQAFASWKANDALSVIVGQVNSNIGYEAEDAPNLYQISKGQLSSIIDGQTDLRGNNVDGVVLAFGAGPANIRLGMLDEIGGNNEANSVLLQAGGSPIDGLMLNLSFVTQEDYDAAFNPNSAGNLLDINGQYGMDNWFVAVDIMDAADDGDGLPDNAYALIGHMDFGSAWATLRYDTVTYNDIGAVSVDDTTSTTLAAGWNASDNLGYNIEFRSDDDGTDTFNSVLLEGIVTLGDFM